MLVDETIELDFRRTFCNIQAQKIIEAAASHYEPKGFIIALQSCMKNMCWGTNTTHNIFVSQEELREFCITRGIPL